MRWMKLLCVGFLHGGEIQFLDKPLFFNWILLGVGLWSSSHGFDFVHSRVEVLDVFWGVQTSRAVVMAGHDCGAKATERQSAPVVAGADAFYLLQIWKMGKTGQLQRFREVPGEECECGTQAFVKSCWLRHAAHSANWARLLLLLLMCGVTFFFIQLAHVWTRGWNDEYHKSDSTEEKRFSLIVRLHNRFISGQTEAQKQKRPHCSRQCHHTVHYQSNVR